MSYGELIFLFLMSLGLAAYPSFMVIRNVLYHSEETASVLPHEPIVARENTGSGIEDFAAEGAKNPSPSDWQVQSLALPVNSSANSTKDDEFTDVVVRMDNYKKRGRTSYAQKSSA
jgi:hypothetical protein